jgi:hypothetical protein
MPRRPPWTVLAYVAVYLVIVVVALADGATAVGLFPFGILVGACLVGLYLPVRVAWILVTALQVVTLLGVLLGGTPWWIVAVVVSQLVLLLSAPTRRYFRRDAPREPQKVSEARRALRLGAAGFASALAVLVLYVVLFMPDPIAGDLQLVRSHRPGLRVLFVGNTLTSDNGMPQMLSDLADADPERQPIFAVRYARRGSTLEDALDDRRLTSLLEDERWNYVVLQEHSQLASRPDERKTHMIPAATALAGMAHRAGAQTVLFSTGAYADGDEDGVDDDTYQAMQTRLNVGYYRVALKLSALLAPVGSAWGQALYRQPGLGYPWADDGRRPSATGSYLTACVFYPLLTGLDPRGNSFTAGLDRAEARRLQELAWRAVRQTYPSSWRETGAQFGG